MRPLLILTILFSFLANVTAEKPFDFATTPGKLPKQVVPTEYSIRIVPNIDKLTFAGSETVKLNVRSPVRQLVLNALEMEIASAMLDGKALPKSAIKIDKKQELLTIALPSELSVGDHTLALDFSGKINQQGQGLFYAPYQEEGTGAEKNGARHAVRSDRRAPLLPMLGRAELSRAFSTHRRCSRKLARGLEHAG